MTQRSITVTDVMSDAALAALVRAAERFGATLPADENERHALAVVTLTEGLRACPSPPPPELAAVVEEWADPVTLRLGRADAKRIREALDWSVLMLVKGRKFDMLDDLKRIRPALDAALAADPAPEPGYRDPNRIGTTYFQTGRIAAPAEGPERAATRETLDSGIAPDWAVEALGVDAWNAVRARYAGCNSCIQEIQAAMPVPAWEVAARGVVEAILAAGWNIAPERQTDIGGGGGDGAREPAG